MERRDFLKLGLAGVGALVLPGKAFALQFYPKPSDKKWAVLYGTWYGTARDAALWISEGTGMIAHVFDVRETPDLKGYDHLVIGSAIQWGRIHPALQEYLEKNQEWLKPKIRGLYVVCGNLGNPVGPQQKEKYIDNHLAKICGVENVPARVFAGRMTPDLLTEKDSQSLKDASAKMNVEFIRSFDNLSRPDCMAFGKEILGAK
jgi:menaquinone-dependent protoporphyrinogen IX oxidase